METTVSAQTPDVAILDEQTAVSRTLIGGLCAAHSKLRIVVLAHEPSRSFGLRLLSYGVAACIPRDFSAKDILDAIHQTADGKQLIASSSPPQRKILASELSTLTSRESEVLNHLQAGATTAEIASMLHIQPETVRSHTKSIYRKLGVRNRRELSIVTNQDDGAV